MKQLIAETDWLASSPVFYNENTGKVSNNVNEVIDLKQLAWHPEGFRNYIDFGYSVFEQTPVKGVRFLRHSSRLWRLDTGVLEVEKLPDPVEKWLDYRLSEKDIIDLIRTRVREWEDSAPGEIVVPTSGGYDSRLLNWCIRDRSRIRSFTYGISDDQSRSHEVAHARRLSELLHTQWRQIELGEFHRNLDEWDALFGISTHAHGMYQMEFYHAIVGQVPHGCRMLSGIYGDGYAGSFSVPPLRGAETLMTLGYTHGLRGDPACCRQESGCELRSEYWETNRDRLQDIRWRTIEAIRLKMLLICYLIRVPAALGLSPWSPFLGIDVAMAMVNLPGTRRANRVWQKEFFAREGLDVEDACRDAQHGNSLYMQALRRCPLRPLDPDILGQVVDRSYVRNINRVLRHPLGPHRPARRISDWLGRQRGGWRLHRLVHEKCDRDDDEQSAAYFGYLTLLPIQNLLLRTSLSKT